MTNSFYRLFLSICIILIPFNNIVFSEEIGTYKPFSSKNYINNNQEIIQKSYIGNASSDYISDNNSTLKDYKLSSGDVLQINISSEYFNLDQTLTISPEGKIFIPKIGEFNAHNIDTEQLKLSIKNKVSKKIDKFELSVLIVKLRNIKVFISGYSQKTGSFSIPYNSRLLDLLKLAEGVNDNGSIRNISITDSNNKKKFFDIYNFIYKGELNDNPILNSGDKIFIPYLSQRIAISGSVSKSGIYEIKEKQDISEIIKFAGGLSTGNSLSNILLHKKGLYSLLDNSQVLDIKPFKESISLEDGDIIYIPESKSISYNYQVHIYGQVNKQGSLQYKEGLKLSDYIKQSGGITNSADGEKVKITRIDNKTKESKIILVDINKVLYEGNTEKDINIEPNDVIFIPEKFFNFRNFSDITSLVLSTLGIVSLVLSFVRN